MEVKLTKTLDEWQAIYNGIQALMQESIPFKEAYWVARSADSIESAIKNLETIRKKMLDRYADKGDDGQPKMTATQDGSGMQYSLTINGLLFQKEWAEVIEQEIEITVFTISMAKISEKLEMIKPGVLKGAMAIIEE